MRMMTLAFPPDKSEIYHGLSIFCDMVSCGEQNVHQQWPNTSHIKTKYQWIAAAHFEGTYKHKSYNSRDPPLLHAALSLHGGDPVAVRFVTVGLGVIERLHLLSAGPLVPGFLFPDQVSAVVEQVTRQQEARQ